MSLFNCDYIFHIDLFFLSGFRNHVFSDRGEVIDAAGVIVGMICPDYNACLVVWFGPFLQDLGVLFQPNPQILAQILFFFVVFSLSRENSFFWSLN